MDEMFNALSQNSEFRDFIGAMAEKIVLDIANDVKLGKLDANEELVSATLLICLQSHSFPFLKALNFAWNGSGDEEGFGAINQFIDKLQLIYFEQESRRKMEMRE